MRESGHQIVTHKPPQKGEETCDQRHERFVHRLGVVSTRGFGQPLHVELALLNDSDRSKSRLLDAGAVHGSREDGVEAVAAEPAREMLVQELDHPFRRGHSVLRPRPRTGLQRQHPQRQLSGQ